MKTRQRLLRTLQQDTVTGEASSRWDTPSAIIAQIPTAITFTRAEVRSGATPTAALRFALRALASEVGPQAGLRGVRRLRPLVARAHEILGKRLEASGAVKAYFRGRTHLADSAVIGLLHIASLDTRIRSGSMIAPLAAVAVGGYGRSELAPSSDLDVLFLLPGVTRGTAATAACVDAVVAGLWDLGFTLDHAARSSGECLDLAHHEPTVLAGLLDRRFLWGEYGLFAGLDAAVANLFAGPDAALWRNAVCTALASTRRGIGDEARAEDDEPDVKRAPGGLRDLQRVLSANPLASGRPGALVDPTLIEAHRFLWLVRCHLHLLAGRAEDRLSAALQPGVARRLMLDDHRGAMAVPRLLNHFRSHAQNVLRAAKCAVASVPEPP